MTRRGWWILMSLAWAFLQARGALADTLLDDFESLNGWSTNHSDHAHVELALDAGQQGRALRIDFEIEPGGSFVIIRKAFPKLSIPKYYALKFWLRGDAPANDFQIKLVDAADRNVWWYNQRGYSFPTDWRHVLVKDPRVQYAWGPAGGGRPTDIGFIEIAIAAGSGGKGSVWLDDLVLEQREVSAGPPPKPKIEASTTLPGHPPEAALDGDPNSMWRSGVLVPQQWIQLDFQKRREYGGLVLEWDSLDYPIAYRVLASEDALTWTVLYESRHGNGGRDYIFTPDAESRYVKVELEQSSRGQGYGLGSVRIQPYELGASPNQFFEAIARESAPGTYPRYFAGQQAYWTVIGWPEGGAAAILSADGALEPKAEGFSLEPFLFLNGALLTWNDVRTTQSLQQGYLPIPSVTWTHERLSLEITAVAGGRNAARAWFARYRVSNTTDEPLDTTLYLALRPFQVLPPWQNLNVVGGVTRIHDLAFDARTVWIDGNPALISQTPPTGFGAAGYDEGSVTEALLGGKLPMTLQVSDPFGYASGALSYALHLEPRATTEVIVALPRSQEDVRTLQLGTNGASAEFQTQLDSAVRTWSMLLGRVELQVPPSGSDLINSMRTSLAHILINREAPALHPGPRTYARAWIRDGASMVTALLQLGFIAEPREFIRWFADYQKPDGQVACCVDRRGADPVDENDSNGELIYTLAEYYRFSRDIGTVSDLWPNVLRAVDWMSSARQRRMTDEYKAPNKRAFYGLLPESISHEGYAGHPVHSYWDDFWALRGLKDASSLAVVVGDEARAAGLAELRDAFRKDLIDSLALTMSNHKLDYLPGSVELADFDANSTAVALSPGDELQSLPQAAVRQTFERYVSNLEQRLRGTEDWQAYTPYELRNVQALVRLGDRAHAWEVLQANWRDQRPLAWRQWPEVVWRDALLPRFIGDMPHAWISAIFIEAVRSLFAYEREDGALVIAAGLPAEWVTGEGGVAVKRLPTHYGVLHYSLRSNGSNSFLLKVSGDLTLPPGKIVAMPPLAQPLRRVQVNGKAMEVRSPDSITIGELPAEVVYEF